MFNLMRAIRLTFIFTMLSQLMLPGAEARDIEREMRRGHGSRTGNERSVRTPGFRGGTPSFAGNGCPEGTMRVVFAPDNLSFTVIFDQFVAQVDESSRRVRRDLMSCTFLVPIQIPEDRQMEIVRVDLRGFVGLPQFSRAAVTSVFNFRGPRGDRDRDRMVLRYKFEGPRFENYEISSDVLSESGQPTGSEISPCGGSTILNVRNELRVTTMQASDKATVTLDSIDGSAEAIYFINWRECSRSGRR